MSTALALVLLATATATPAPAPAPAPRPVVADIAPQRGLAAAAAGRRLNRAVSFSQDRIPDALPPSAPAPAPKSASAAAATTEAPPAATPKTNALDEEEAHWRGRYRDLRDRLRAAEGELAAAERANPILLNRYGHTLIDAEATRNAALTPYRLKVNALRDEMARLPEQCRRAGCQPGWIRD